MNQGHPSPRHAVHSPAESGCGPADRARGAGGEPAPSLEWARRRASSPAAKAGRRPASRSGGFPRPSLSLRSARVEPHLAGQSGEPALPVPGPESGGARRCGTTGGCVPDDPAGGLGGGWGVRRGFLSALVRRCGFSEASAQRGFRVRYAPGAVARHVGGHSVGRIPWESREVCWYGSLLRYSFKHFRVAGRVLVWAAVVTGCALRAVYGVLRQWKLSPLAVYGRVIRSRASGWCRAGSGRLAVCPLWRDSRAFDKVSRDQVQAHGT